LPDRVNTL